MTYQDRIVPPDEIERARKRAAQRAQMERTGGGRHAIELCPKCGGTNSRHSTRKHRCPA